LKVLQKCSQAQKSYQKCTKFSTFITSSSTHDRINFLFFGKPQLWPEWGAHNIEESAYYAPRLGYLLSLDNDVDADAEVVEQGPTSDRLLGECTGLLVTLREFLMRKKAVVARAKNVQF
jgi:hypothetical protein